MKHLVLISLVLLVFGKLQAQEVYRVEIFGAIVSDFEPIPTGVFIKVTEVKTGDTIPVERFIKNGVYNFEVLNLAFDNTYKVLFGAKSHQSKYVVIDIKDVPKESREGGLGFDLSVNLWPLSFNMPVDLIKDERMIGIANYSPKDSAVSFSQIFTDSLKRDKDFKSWIDFQDQFKTRLKVAIQIPSFSPCDNNQLKLSFDLPMGLDSLLLNISAAKYGQQKVQVNSATSQFLELGELYTITYLDKKGREKLFEVDTRFVPKLNCNPLYCEVNLNAKKKQIVFYDVSKHNFTSEKK